MLARIPFLQAQDSMRAATATAVGTGSMKKHDLEAQIRSWQRLMPKPPPATDDEMMAFSAGMRPRV